MVKKLLNKICIYHRNHHHHLSHLNQRELSGGGGVTKKIVKYKGRVTFLNTLRTGSARTFYITVAGNSSGPPPLLKMNAPILQLAILHVLGTFEIFSGKMNYHHARF